ncbi:MAG: very short patch repair endonuclease [Limisphaerales bacterium]
MSDIFTKAKRSEVMSRIRSRGNKNTELVLAKLFRRHKITGWRRQVQIVTSPADTSSGLRPTSPHQMRRRIGQCVRVRPDFIFPRLKLAIFVDGCFWHVCPKHGTQPKGNRVFWKKKFARNKARDFLVTRTLRSQGWRVLRIWEHDLHRATKNEGNETHLIRRLQRHFQTT